MLDVVLLGVLVTAIAIGFGLGYRQALRRPDPAPPAASPTLSRDYFIGLNYLLNEQPDEAINTFIQALDVNSDTVDTHIALGKLFRTRGEADKAVNIHQNLLARPALSVVQNEQVQLELARNFMALGVHDRARRLLYQIEEQSQQESHRVAAIRLLVDLFEREQDWQAALDVTWPLLSQQTDMKRPAAHWQCELARQDRDEASRPLAQRRLKKALQLDPQCVRASLMLADLALDNGRYATAIARLGHIADQEAAYIPTMLPALQHAYLCNHDDAGYERHLLTLLDIAHYTSVIVNLGELAHQRDGVDTAIALTGERLGISPSLGGLDYLLDLYIESQRLSGRETPDSRLRLLKHHTRALLDDRPRYRCEHCGFSGATLVWQCPSCRHWGSVKPIIGVEGE
ncbi:lipopolysaccharide assembly protein LapB [Vreelandella jeotgali]|uniref:lipopolysaccharide assembly protein LapB n=1 Tax=Vreelandella jeotgali TaxID=553386 RepID=UPI00034A0751|nr:lipopolysaccharide assembly protein LapB [Halomonas jeotgali]